MARRIVIELMLAVIVGALLGLLGPFGTYSFGAGTRMAYWIFMMVAGLLIFRPTLIASGWLAREVGLPGWVASVLAVAIGSLPMTLLVMWQMSGFDVTGAIQHPGLPVIYGNVFLISLLTTGFYLAAFRNREAGPIAAPPHVQPASEAVDELQSLFESRLPAGFGSLLALSSEDHYVRAHSDSASTLILIRLRDAIAELDPAIEGSQVHRSWWVAREAVSYHKSDGRAMRLSLTNGLEVPVSRERIASLRADGWF